MSVSLLDSLLLKEEFIGRFGFTSEPPIVAATTFPKFLKILDPPCYFCLLHSATCLDCLRPVFIAIRDSFWVCACFGLKGLAGFMMFYH